MKQIKLFIFTILVCIPIIVQAEMKNIELETQFNTEYTNLIYRGEYLLSTYSLKDTDNNYFKALNLDGTIIHETIYEGSIVGVDENYTYTLLKEEEKVYHFYKYENITGKQIAELEVKYEKTMDIQLSFFNNYGIVIRDWWDNDCFIVDKGLSGYEEVTVTSEILVNENYDVKRNDLVSEEEYLNIKNYLLSNGFYEYELSIDYAIEYQNQYYTAVTKEGNISSIIGINKELTEHTITPINNEDFISPYSKYIQDIYTYNHKLTIVIEDNARCPMSNQMDHIGDQCTNNVYLQIYKLKYTIDTKTDGNGTIEVDYVAVEAGTEVKFTIEPKEGYVLGEVKVTDKNGNSVVFTDYTFTMPSADVIIEATFIKKEVPSNPETQDNIIFLLFFLFLSGTFILVNIKKNLS